MISSLPVSRLLPGLGPHPDPGPGGDHRGGGPQGPSLRGRGAAEEGERGLHPSVPGVHPAGPGPRLLLRIRRDGGGPER